MTNPDGTLHAALMAFAETALAGEVILWPAKGGDKPAGEHIRVYHLPNDNAAADLSGQTQERMGFLIITLVSDLDQHEAAIRQRAGAIAALFPRGTRTPADNPALTFTGYTIRPGRQEGQRWETPIRISYWSMT